MIAVAPKLQEMFTDREEYEQTKELKKISALISYIKAANAILTHEVIGKMDGDQKTVAKNAKIILETLESAGGISGYTNFYARTSAGGNDNSVLQVAGAANLINVTNSANVNVAGTLKANTDSSVLTDEEKADGNYGKINLRSKSTGDVVSFTGDAAEYIMPHLRNWVPDFIQNIGIEIKADEAARGGLGAAVNVTSMNGVSTVTIADNAVLSGRNIVIDANNSLVNKSVAFGNNKAGTLGISGMVNVITGDSKAQTAVNNATITASEALSMNSTNTTSIANVAGAFMRSNNMGLGAGVALNRMDVVTQADLAGTIFSKAIDVHALTDGSIHAVGVAGAGASGGSANQKNAVSDAAENGSVISQVDDQINQAIQQAEDDEEVDLQNLANNEQDANQGGQAVAGNNNEGNNNEGNNNEGDKTKAKFQIGIAGSVAINRLNSTTSASIKNATVSMSDDEQSHATVNVTAQDDAFLGSWAGAAATNWAAFDSENSPSSGASMGGAAAVNMSDNTVNATLMNSTITNADTVAIHAKKAGAEVAAAMGLAVNSSSEDSSTNADLGIAVSYSKLTNRVNATTEENTIHRTDRTEDKPVHTDVNVLAEDSDLQVTGGVDVAWAKGNKNSTSLAAGVGVAISNIDNTVESTVQNNTLSEIGDLSVRSGISTKQITAGVGIAKASGGTSGSLNTNIVKSTLVNTVDAAIRGGQVTADGNVGVLSYDGNVSDNKYTTYLQSRGIDATGESYKNSIESNKTDDDGKETTEATDYNQAMTTAAGKAASDANPTSGGNLIIGGALSLASSDAVSVGASVSLQNITNKRTATISDTTITANTVTGLAENETTAIDVAAGYAGADNLSAAGSFTWQTIDNRAITTVENSTIQTNALAVNAKNDALSVNVAGQIEKGNATAGLAAAVHDLKGTTGAYVKGSTIQALDDAASVDVAVDAQNDAKTYSVGVGVGLGKDYALKGVFAGNYINNNTEAIIDQIAEKKDENDSVTQEAKNTLITNANKVAVTTEDNTTSYAIAGGAETGGKASLGGAIAFNHTGKDAAQKNTAQINNTDITSTSKTNAVAIRTHAVDTSDLTSYAVGTGIAGSGAAIQGSLINTSVNKVINSGLQNTNINQGASAPKNVNLDVQASNESAINNRALVLSVGDHAGIGAAVSTSNVTQTMMSQIAGGTQRLNDANVIAVGNPSIHTIAVGGGVAKNNGAAIAGSMSINKIQNDSFAKVSGATLTGDGNIVVKAKNDETIDNKAGAVSVAAGDKGGVAVGLALNYNEINGSTQAIVENSSVAAAGNDNSQTDITKYTSEIDKDEKDEAKKDIYVVDYNKSTDAKSGLVVNADSTHELFNLSISGGVAAGSTAGVAVDGNVAINKLNGDTTAAINKSNINASMTKEQKGSDVTVRATDYTKSKSFVGTFSVGTGGTAGVAAGASSDNLTVTRNVSASITGTSDTQHNTVNGRTIDVQAQQYGDMVTNADALGVAASGTGSASLMGSAVVADMHGTTTATVENINSTNHGLNVKADHKQKDLLVTATAAVSASYGSGSAAASVNLFNDESNTSATLKNSNITATQYGENETALIGNVIVDAENETMVQNVVSAASIAASIGGAAGVNYGVNHLNSTTATVVDNATIDADGDFLANAENVSKLLARSYQVSGSLIAGIGVLVNTNTIDTGVSTSISNGSAITAKNIGVLASDDIHVKQKGYGATVGGLSVGANIMTTTIGAELEDSYGTGGTTANDGNVNTSALLAEANSTLKGYNTIENNKIFQGKLNAANGENRKPETTITANKGKNTSEGTVVKVVGGSSLQATDSAIVLADHEVDAEQSTGQGQIGIVNVSVPVASLDMSSKTGTMIDNATIAGKDVYVLSSVGADATLDAKQFGLSGIGVTVANAHIKNNTQNTVTVRNGSKLAGTNLVGIAAATDNEEEIHVYGLTSGSINVGIVNAGATNTSNTSVTIGDNSSKAVTLDAKDGSVYVGATNDSRIDVTSTGGQMGIGSGVGVDAMASDNSNVAVNLVGAGNVITADLAMFEAENTPDIAVYAGNTNLGLVAAQNVKAESIVESEVNLNVANDNVFHVNDLSFIASVGVDNKDDKTDDTENKDYTDTEVTSIDNVARATAKIDTTGLSVGVGVGVNEAKATTDTKVNVNIGRQIYTGTKAYGTDGDKQYEAMNSLEIEGYNNIERVVESGAVSVGGIVAVTNSKAISTGKDTINVSAEGMGDSRSIDVIRINADGNETSTVTVDGSGGGIVDASPYAAKGYNNVYNNVDVTVNGTWKADRMAVEASQTDIVKTDAHATHGGGVVVNGVDGYITIGGEITDEATNQKRETGKTTVTIGDNANIEAKKLEVGAYNTIITDLQVKGNSYAVAGFAYPDSVQNVDKKTAVVIGNGAQITTDEAQKYTAYTKAILSNKLNSNVVGVWNSTSVTGKDTIKIANAITSNGTLRNTGSLNDNGLTMSASDDIEEMLKASADTVIGLAGTTSGRAESTINRNNKIDIQSGSLKSDSNINLYAGASDSGNASNLNMELYAYAYNHTAAPFKTNPTISYQVTDNNIVNVAKGASGIAKNDINIIADGGESSIVKETQSWKWVQGGNSTDRSYVGSAHGKVEKKNEVDQNKVTVDGTLIAGSDNKVDITITGTVIPGFNSDTTDENGTRTVAVTEVDKDKTTATVSDAFTITVTGQDGIAQSIKTSDMDYSSELTKRLETLNTLIQQYYQGIASGDNSHVTAYTGYVQERERVVAEMTKLGLMEVSTKTDDQGNTLTQYSVITEGYKIKTITIPDIEVSGGDINIKTIKLTGSGELNANGSPHININNESSGYLILNDLKIGKEGGHVVYNNTNVTNSAEVISVNERNGVTDNSDVKLNFNGTNGGDSSGINITNEWKNTGTITLKTKTTVTPKNGEPTTEITTAEYKPILNVEVQGMINNPISGVTIRNNSGSITIDESSNTREVGINGKEITLVAKGDIVQSFTDGTVNIGGNPEDDYANVSRDLRDKFLSDVSDKSVDAHKVYTKDDTTRNPYSHIQAYIRRNAEFDVEALQTYYTMLGNNQDEITEDIATKTISNQLKKVYELIMERMSGEESASGYIYAKAFMEKINSLKEQDSDFKTVIANNTQLQQTIKFAQKIVASYGNSSKTSVGRIAGGNVYLSATNINVNGLIQSGYDTYKVSITDQDVADVIANKDFAESRQIQGRTMYKVNDGGHAVFSNDKYVYEVQVYYDPATNSLYVEDIDTQGGNVYLSGNIISTGNGRILAADGGADITIDNQSNYQLEVGKISNNNLEGKITITDGFKDQQTIYTKGNKQTITNYSKYIVDKSKGTVIDSTEGTNVYEINPGERYNWTSGTETSAKTEYTSVRSDTWWGLNTGDTDKSALKEESTAVSYPEGTSNLNNGVFIGQSTDLSDDYVMIADNVSTENSSTDVVETVKKSGLFGWRKTHTFRWTEYNGSKQTYVNSVKADKDIEIGFLGKDDATITINGGASINLNGNIKNNSAVATTSITSGTSAQNTTGDIVQAAGTTLTGNNFTFNSQGDIKSIDITSMGTVDSDIVRLSALSAFQDDNNHTDGGNIDITVHSGYKNGAYLPGTVAVGSIVTESGGNVSLTADGSIVQGQAANGAYSGIDGKRIDLVSNNGTIGTAAQALNVNIGQNSYGTDTLSASLNATAKGDINIAQVKNGANTTQFTSNMRVGTIKSQEGNIILTATEGDFIDATPNTISENNASTDSRIANWVEDGQVHVNTAKAQAEANKAVENYQVKAANDYASIKDAVNAYIAEFGDAKTAQAYLENVKQNVDSDYSKLLAAVETAKDSASKASAQEAVTAYETKIAEQFSSYKTYADMLGNADSAEAYLENLAKDSTSEYSKLLAKKDNVATDWTVDQMLFAIDDIISNKTTTKEAVSKAANIYGKNITLKGQNVGVNDDKTTRIETEGLATNYDNLKKLANAEYSDVTREYSTDEQGNEVTTAFIINNKVPLGVDLTSTDGVLTVENTKAGSNVYISGRTEEAETASDLRIKNIDTSAGDTTGAKDKRGNVTLYGENATAVESGTNIKADDLLIVSNGNIGAYGGSVNDSVVVDLTGDLSARAANVINIENADYRDLTYSNVLKVNNLYAADLIKLSSGTGIEMGSDKNAYIQAGREILFGVHDHLGKADDAVRVLANGARVQVRGYEYPNEPSDYDIAENVYLEGKYSSNQTEGTLLLGDVYAKKDIEISSLGDIQIGSRTDGYKFTSHVNAGEKVAISAGGAIHAEDAILSSDSDYTDGVYDGNITLTAEKEFTHGKGGVFGNNATISGQSIVQEATARAVVNDLTLAATGTGTIKDENDNIIDHGGITLNSGYGTDGNDLRNILKNVTVTNADASRDVVIIGGSNKGTNDNPEKLTVNFASGNQANNVTVKNVDISNKTFVIKDEVVTPLSVTGTVNAAGNVTIANEEQGTIDVESVNAGGNVNITSKDDVTTTGTIKGNDVVIQSTEGNVSTNNVTATATDAAKGNVTISANGNVTSTGNVTSNTNATITAANGNAEVNNVSTKLDSVITANNGTVATGAITAETGKVDIDAKNMITTNGPVKAGTTVDIESKEGNITANDKITSTGSSVKLTANGDITTHDEVSGDTTVDIKSTNGNINLDGTVRGNGKVTIAAENGAIETVVDGTLKSRIIVSRNDDVSITAKDAIQLHDMVVGQNVTVTSSESSVSVDSGIRAVNGSNGNATITAKDDVQLNNVTATKDVEIKSNTGKVTTGGVDAENGKVDIEAKGAVQTNGYVEAGTNVDITSQDSSVTTKSIVNAKNGNTTITGKNDVIAEKEVKAKKNAAITAQNGAITTDAVHAATEDVIIHAHKEVTTNGSVNAGRDVIIISDTSNITSNAGVTAGEDASITAQNGAITTKAVTATAGAVDIDAKNAVETQGAISAGKSVDMNTANGDITVKGDVTSGTTTKIDAVNGDITVYSDETSPVTVKAGTGAELIATEGNVNVIGTVKSDANDVVIKAVDNGTTDEELSDDVGNVTIIGSVDSAAKADIDAVNGNVAIVGKVKSIGATDIDVTNGDIGVIGGIEAGTSATLDTTKGDITVVDPDGDAVGSIVAKDGDVTMNTGEAGDISIAGNVEASNDVIATTKDGDITLDGDVSAGKNIDVTTTVTGNIEIDGNVNAGQNVYATAQETGNVDVVGDVTAGKDVLADTKTGYVKYHGDVVAGEDIIAMTDSGDIAFEGKANAQGDIGAITKTGDILFNGDVDAGNNVTANADEKGNITFNGDVDAGNNVEAVTKEGNIAVEGTVDAVQNITAHTDQGNVTVKNNVTAKDGNVQLTTDEGDIEVDGATKAGNNVIVASEEGNVTINDNVTSGKAVDIDASNGHVTIIGNVKSGTYADIDTVHGDVIINGNVTSGTNTDIGAVNGDVIIDGKVVSGTHTDIDIKNGDIGIIGSIEAGTSVTLDTTKGDITVVDPDGDAVGSIVAKDGDVTMNTGEAGDISIAGNVEASNDVIATTKDGDITIIGNVEADNNVDTSTNNGDIVVWGDVNARNDVKATTDNGDITVLGDVTADNNLTAETKVEGDISIIGSVDVKHDIDFVTNKGDITITNPIQTGNDFSASSNEGDITFTNITTGNDVHLIDRNGDITGDTVNAVNDIEVLDKKGDINIDTLVGQGDESASNVVSVVAMDGVIDVDTISGKIVAAEVLKDDSDGTKHLNVQNIIAADVAKIKTSDVDVTTIKQRDDGKGALNLVMVNTDGQNAMNNVKLEHIEAKYNSGITIRDLWVDTADIRVTQGALNFDNLYVEKEGYFTNGVMKTKVYGGDVKKDYDPSIHSTYWNDVGLNNPKDRPGFVDNPVYEPWKDRRQYLLDLSVKGGGANLASATGNYVGDGTYLHFGPQNRMQYSNGNLLDLAEHYYVYNQRYSTTNWMRRALDEDFYRYREGDDIQELNPLYDRYDLVEHEVIPVYNSTDIVVE